MEQTYINKHKNDIDFAIQYMQGIYTNLLIDKYKYNLLQLKAVRNIINKNIKNFKTNEKYDIYFNLCNQNLEILNKYITELDKK